MQKTVAGHRISNPASHNRFSPFFFDNWMQGVCRRLNKTNQGQQDGVEGMYLDSDGSERRLRARVLGLQFQLIAITLVLAILPSTRYLVVSHPIKSLQ